MNEKEKNLFRLALYQENVLLCEKIFDANLISPFTRYSVDIREFLPKIINMLQKVLSKKKYNTKINEGDYDLYEYAQNIIKLYPEKIRNHLEYNPEPKVQHIENRVIKGVECKLGLYINDNPIVERIFYVDGFNPVARWSVDLLKTFVDIADTIFNYIIKTDIKNIWDDYDLINIKGLNIVQIRELPLARRIDLLNSIKNRKS